MTQKFALLNEDMQSCWGACELAFDYNNGDVITEADVAAEVCRAVKDIDG
jgi:hypothetical protein